MLAPVRRLPADDRGRQAILARFAPAMQRIVELYFESGLWERAAEYDGPYRAGAPEERLFRCYESGLLALASGDVSAYRAIASEAVDRAAGRDDFWTFNALRTATLGLEGPVAPERLVEMARRLVARGPNDVWGSWYRIELGNALSRAGRHGEALAAIGEECSLLNGKAVVARIHARAGRAEQARRWLRALEPRHRGGDRAEPARVRRAPAAGRVGGRCAPGRTPSPGRRMPRSARRLPSCGASG